MSPFVWIAAGMFGSCIIGFAAGMYAALYEPPAPPLRYVEPPGSHVFVVRSEYNGMPLDGLGYSDAPEFYDWERHGEA